MLKKFLLSITVHAGLFLVLTAGPIWAQINMDKLTASDAAYLDEFGFPLSVSGDIALVGVPFDGEGGANAGAAYVFRYNAKTEEWIQIQKLSASDPEEGDRFGFAVSISSEVALVGAPENEDGGSRPGSAYVFRRDDNGTPSDPRDDFWGKGKKLTASDPQPGDQFGFSVSVRGDIAVVGSPKSDERGSNSGAAYVYQYHRWIWAKEKKLTPSDASRDDQFGYSVSVSKNFIIVGAPYDDPQGENSGSAYVFWRHDNDTQSNLSNDFWREGKKLTPSKGTIGSKFGSSVSIFGEIVLVGAPNADHGERICGSAYLFRRDQNHTPLNLGDDNWKEEQKLVPSDVDNLERFGWFVSANKDTALVGSYHQDNGGKDYSGWAYVFIDKGKTWAEEEVKSHRLGPNL